jgi:ribonucleoside-diphosphate reductase alpha chain
MSFGEVFDSSAKVIRNGGGRRSAHILLMDVSHPDIEEFITYKQGDTNKKLTSFNISVGISQEFIDAVKADADWHLVHDGLIYKTVRARELLQKIAQHAFIHNEPGILIYPSIEKRNFGWYTDEIGNINACNPCLTGRSLVPVTFDDVETTMTIKNMVAAWEGGELRDAKVLSYNEATKQSEWKPLLNALKTRKNAAVIRITDTSTGRQIECTPDHLILTERGWVEAQNLTAEDVLIQA